MGAMQGGSASLCLRRWRVLADEGDAMRARSRSQMGMRLKILARALSAARVSTKQRAQRLGRAKHRKQRETEMQ